MPLERGWEVYARSDASLHGAVAQVVERLLCKQQVRGSSPRSSTTNTNALLSRGLGTPSLG
jgi:hypothetical protein